LCRSYFSLTLLMIFPILAEIARLKWNVSLAWNHSWNITLRISLIFSCRHVDLEGDIMHSLRQDPSLCEWPRAWVFGSGKWNKRWNDEELPIIYRYLASSRCKWRIREDNAIVYFHHAASAEGTDPKKIKKIVIPDVQDPVVWGHNKQVV
jgi:hypothetical protein